MPRRKQVERMAEIQYVYINGRRRQGIIIRGQEYVREGHNLPIWVAEAFEKRCNLWGEDKSKIVERLVKELIHSTGLNDDRIKQPGDLYDRTGTDQIKEAVVKTKRKLFPWIFSIN